MKRKFISILLTIVIVLSFSLVATGVWAFFGEDVETSTTNSFQAGTLDLTVNDTEPWTNESFTFTGIVPGGVPMAFDFKLHNVGDAPGILTFQMTYVENDMEGAPDPNMSADAFASLVYVEAVSYQYIWLDDPEGPYTGSVRDDLDSWLAMDANSDGYVSLFEICQVGVIPYGDYEGDQFEAGAEITYFIEFQLGDSLGVDNAILLGELDNTPQGDGVSVTIIATLAPVPVPSP